MCERLITQLLDRQYRNVLRYLVLFREDDGRLAVKAEHPVRADWLVGYGITWPEAFAELLREIETRTATGG